MLLAMRIGAVALILLGLVWLGQGLGYIPGSFMTGQAFWALAGFVCVVAGGFLAYLGFLRPRPGA